MRILNAMQHMLGRVVYQRTWLQIEKDTKEKILVTTISGNLK